MNRPSVDADGPQPPSGTTPAGRSSRKKRRMRLTREERRAQIAEVTLHIMARYGLQETTVSRIAEEVGIEAPSLYQHYANRHEMIVAAMEIMFERVRKHLTNDPEPNMLKRLRSIAQTHDTFISGEFDGFVIPTFEILTAPRDTGLSKLAGDKQLEAIDTLAGFVQEGQSQGTIRKGVDPRLVAYELTILFWAEDIAQLMGIDEFVSGGISGKILDLFLEDIAGEPRPSTGDAS